MHTRTVRDDQVLNRRIRGESFDRIARVLGYKRSGEATRAFNRALRRKLEPEQKSLRLQELRRLDAIAFVVQMSTALTTDEIAHRLRTVERRRGRLLVD